MAFADVIQNGVASVTGAIAKGYFKIKDLRSENDASPKRKEVEKTTSGGALGKLGGATKAADGVTSKVKKIGNGSIKSLISKGTGISQMNSGDGYDCVFELPFNPNSLQITSRAGDDDVMKNDYSSAGRNMSMGSINLHIELSVTFIFDQIVDRMAFAQDNLTLLSVNKVVSDVAGGIKNNIMSDGNASVQQAVEAFVAALRNPRLRKCCFEWGDMYYEGFLRHVNTKYTMFDFAGRPIRGEVTVIMYLEDARIEEHNLGIWEDSYEKIFGGKDSVSFVKKSQKVGNLLNL